MRRHTHRLARTTSLVAAAALLATGLQGLPASAATKDPSDLVEGCQDAPSASKKFVDYGTLNARQRVVVDCLSAGYKGNGGDSDFVLQGSGPEGSRRLDFDKPISRAQFSAILNRVADYLKLEARAGNPNKPTFADVGVNHFFFGEIEELFARKLTNGAGKDVDDVDEDNDTEEPVYNPNGEVSYGQVLAFLHRLLAGPDGVGEQLASDQSKGQANNLSCGFFDNEKAILDNAGFLISANIPADCRAAAPRGLVFDLIAVAFDETVESGLANNPFAEAPGTIAISADKTSETVGQLVSITVTVRDAEGQPVKDQPVDVFGVASGGSGFNADGSPKNPGNLSVAGTNRNGSGSTAAVIDASDPVTDATGKATVTVGTSDASGGSFDLYAFQGKSGAAYQDVKNNQGVATGKVTVTFNPAPADIKIEPLTNKTLKFGGPDVDGDAQSWGIVFTVVDANGKAIESAGTTFTADLFRREDPETSATLESRIQLTTDSKGKVTWRPPAATDANLNETGQDADDTVEAYILAGDGVTRTVESSEDLALRWLDMPRSTPAIATISITNNNGGKADVHGAAPQDGPQQLFVNVTNVYGKAADGAKFQLSSSEGTSQLTTNSDGTQVVQLAVPQVIRQVDYTVRVDGNNDGVYTGPQDVTATSPTGDTDVTIHWVNDPPATVGTGEATPYSVAGITGTGAGSIYIYNATTRVKLIYDGNDVYFSGTSVTSSCPPAQGEGIGGASGFASALKADASQNDQLRVQYNSGAGTTSCWVLNVVADSGSFPTP